MKTTYHYVCACLVAMAALASSCNDFLDTTPDSRIQVDNEEKVKALLTTAYPQATFVRATELASDNADDLNGDLNGNYDRFSEQCYRWQPVTESDNENPTMIWQDYYKAIASANHALAAMEKMGGATTEKLMNPAKRNVLDLKNETCKNREKRNVLKISHTRHFKATKKQSKMGCFYSF